MSQEKGLVSKSAIAPIEEQLSQVNDALKKYEGLLQKKKRLEWAIALLRGEELEPAAMHPALPAPAQQGLPFSEDDFARAMDEEEEAPRLVGSSEAKNLGVRARLRNEPPRSLAGVKTVLDVLCDYFEEHPDTTRQDALRWMRENYKEDFAASHLNSAITKLKDRGFLGCKERAGQILYSLLKREPSHSLVLGQHHDALLDWIREHPGQLLAEIAAGVGLAPRSIENYMASMRKLDKVRTNGERPYRYYAAEDAPDGKKKVQPKAGEKTAEELVAEILASEPNLSRKQIFDRIHAVRPRYAPSALGPAITRLMKGGYLGRKDIDGAVVYFVKKQPPPSRSSQLGALQDEVVAYLAKHPGSHEYEIANGMSMHRSTLRRHIFHLLDKGRLRKDGFRYFAEGEAPAAALIQRPGKSIAAAPGEPAVVDLMYDYIEAHPGAISREIAAHVIQHRPTATFHSVGVCLRTATKRGAFRTEVGSDGKSRVLRYYAKKRIEARQAQLWKIWKPVIDAIRAEEGRRVERIAEVTNMAPEMVQHLLATLRKREWVRIDGERPYRYFIGPKAPPAEKSE